MEKLRMEKISNKKRKVVCNECHCDSIKVSSTFDDLISISLAFLLITCFLMLVPILGWALAPFTGGISTLTSVIALPFIFEKNCTLTCEVCGTKYRVNKKELKRYTR